MSAIPPGTGQDISLWVVEIQQNLTNAYICISTISLLSHDVLLNLEREIEYIWKAKWSISKALFIFARYHSLIYMMQVNQYLASVAPTDPLDILGTLYSAPSFQWSRLSASPCNCRGWLWVLLLAGEVPVATIANILLTMRLYAMYQSKKALVFFILLIICQFTLELYVAATTRINASVIPVPTGIPMPGCIAAYSDLSAGLISYVPMLFIATAFFAMTIIRFINDRRRTLIHLMDIKYLSPLVVSIVYDGALFYILQFVVLLVSIIMLKVSESLALNTSLMLILWRLGIYSWSASRLVLNLRETASRHTNMGTTTMSMLAQTMTTPEFTPNPMSMQNLDSEG